jgi:hypothetical protein
VGAIEKLIKKLIYYFKPIQGDENVGKKTKKIKKLGIDEVGASS